MEATRPQVKRRLYTLYPEQIAKLEQLSRKEGVSQSQILRQLIDDAYERAIVYSMSNKELVYGAE